jgi:hypothetical protein
MNLYFQSFLEKDKERKKNVVNVYPFTENNLILSEKYLKTRFPFLSVGDIVNHDRTIGRYWDGHKLVHRMDVFGDLHPYFYLERGGWFNCPDGIWSRHGVSGHACEAGLSRIDQYTFEVDIIDYKSVIHTPRYKIGNRRYAIFFVWNTRIPPSFESNLLIEKIRKSTRKERREMTLLGTFDFLSGRSEYDKIKNKILYVHISQSLFPGSE